MVLYLSSEVKKLSIPDNLDAFNRHEARQEAQLARMPKCEKCGDYIQDDDLFDIDGVLYHEDCAVDLFRKSTENYIKEI